MEDTGRVGEGTWVGGKMMQGGDAEGAIEGGVWEWQIFRASLNKTRGWCREAGAFEHRRRRLDADEALD